MIDSYEILKRLEDKCIELGRERVLYERMEAEVSSKTTSTYSIERIVVERTVVELIDALANSRKIEAIKAFRTLTGYGLRESKDAVERVTTLYRSNV